MDYVGPLIVRLQGCQTIQVQAVLNGLAAEAASRKKQLHVDSLPPYADGAVTLIIRELDGEVIRHPPEPPQSRDPGR